MNEIYSQNGVSYMIRETPYVRRAMRDSADSGQAAGRGRAERTAKPNSPKRQGRIKPGFNRPDPRDEQER